MNLTALQEHALILAVFCCACAANIFVVVRFALWRVVHLRLQIAMLGEGGARFTNTDAFCAAVHELAHKFDVDVTGVCYDQQTKAIQTYNFGPENCDGSPVERAKDHEIAATWLAKDAIALRRLDDAPPEAK